MKKLLILSLFFNLLSNATGNNVRVIFKSGLNSNISLATKPITIRNNYTPIDLTISSKDKKFNANLVVKGRINDLASENYISNFEKVEQDFETKLPESETKTYEKKVYDFDLDKNITSTLTKEEIYGISFTGDENLKSKFITPSNVENIVSNPGIRVNEESFIDGHSHHNHSHGAHNHSHNHSHNNSEEEHKHFKRESFIPLNPKYTRNGKSRSNIQSKIDLEYFNGKNGIKYVQYLTDYEEKEEGVKFKGDGLLQIRNINLISDNFSIAFTPRIYTRKFIKPHYIDLDFDARYKKDDNTTIGLFYYTAHQLDDLKYIHHQKNKISLFYDMKVPYFKGHEFYEILDHEHENKDEFKLAFSYSKEDKKYLNVLPLKLKNPYDSVYSNTETDFLFKFKKSDIFTKNLSFSNEFSINKSINSSKKLNLILQETKKRKYEDDSLKDLINEDSLDDVSVETLLKKTYKLEDRFEIHKLNKYSNKDLNLTTRYLDIVSFIPLEIDPKKPYFYKINKNQLELNNNTKLEYSMNKATLSFENKFKYNKNYISKEYVVNDKTILNYKTKANSNIILDLILQNNYTYYHNIIGGIFANTHTNTVSYGGKVGYNFKFNKIKISPYTEIKHDLEFRKADANSVKTKSEANKVVFGQVIKLKHGIDLEAKLRKDLKLNGKFSVKYRFDNSVYKNSDNNLYSEKTNIFSKIPPLFDLNIGLTYFY